MKFTKETTIYNEGSIDGAIADASAKATNYISNSADDGLVVGNMTEDTLRGNVQITSEPSVKLRDDEQVMASFAADEIQLGNDTTFSAIKMLKSALTIYGSDNLASRNAHIIMSGGDKAGYIFIGARKDGIGDSPMLILATDGIGVVENVSGIGKSIPMWRKDVSAKVSHNSSECSLTGLNAHVAAGMLHMSGIIHNNAAGTNKFLVSVTGCEPLATTQFPMACYSGNACEGWAVAHDGDTRLYFNFPSVHDWRFNFSVPVK